MAEDGTKLPVDGLAPGQSMEVKLVKYKDGAGRISFEVEFADEDK